MEASRDYLHRQVKVPLRTFVCGGNSPSVRRSQRIVFEVLARLKLMGFSAEVVGAMRA